MSLLPPGGVAACHRASSATRLLPQGCLIALSGDTVVGGGVTDLPLGLGHTIIATSLFRSPAGEKNTYALLGKATDPVAEGHIVLDCQARTHQGKRVAVPNVVPKKAAEYRYGVVPCANCWGCSPEAFVSQARRRMGQQVLCLAQVGCFAIL